MCFSFDSWEFYGLLTEGLTLVQMPILIRWEAQYITDPRAIFHEDFPESKNLDCCFASAALTAGTTQKPEVVSRGISLYPNLRYLNLMSTPMSWDMFCPSNLIELHIHRLPLQYRPHPNQLRQILEFSQDTLQVLELSGTVFQNHAFDSPLTMSRVHTLKIGFSLAEELQCLFPQLLLPALTSLEVNNLDRKSTWFGRPPEDMVQAAIAAFEVLAGCLPLDQLKHLRLDCITFQLPRNKLLSAGQEHVSFLFLNKLTSLTSLSLYSPDVITLGCMSDFPDILPALKVLKISTPGVNYYEHILSFWQERARMRACTILECFELTLPVCAKEKAEAIVQRDEVFAKKVVLRYQPDLHPPLWMLEDDRMEDDDADEMDDEEMYELEGDIDEMDED